MIFSQFSKTYMWSRVGVENENWIEQIWCLVSCEAQLMTENTRNKRIFASSRLRKPPKPDHPGARQRERRSPLGGPIRSTVLIWVGSYLRVSTSLGPRLSLLITDGKVVSWQRGLVPWTFCYGTRVERDASCTCIRGDAENASSEQLPGWSCQ